MAISPLPLGYCTNVHPGRTVAEVLAGLDRYAVPVRERILKLSDQAKGTAEIIASIGYCVAAVRRVRQRFKARGTLGPQPHRCGPKTLLTDSRKARLLQRLEPRSDATLAELGAPFKRPASTMDLSLTWLGGVVKRETGRPSLACRCEAS